MNPAFRKRLIRSRIRISDVEDTRREESFNGRCPNGRISYFNRSNFFIGFTLLRLIES
nr:MAG TPA: hypothetical protein [Caudoviricetes sp.]